MSDANTKKAHDTCLHCLKFKLAPKIILLSINEVHDCLLVFTLTLLTDNHHLARYSNRFLSHNLSKLVFFPSIQTTDILILTNTLPLIKCKFKKFKNTRLVSMSLKRWGNLVVNNCIE